ncbi:MAG TPA: helix-turn-helix domain-containing protein [Candidatus Limnocylindrales bacterium]|nr:helix-turn-helix domain-containing protein [Candidatus Limnocylindrales bacterium]
MSRYVTLAEVARRTGRHPEQLRQWCASGRLPCERFGRDWLLDAADLPLVDQVATRRRHVAVETRTVVGASFTDGAAGRRALSQARQQFEIDPKDAALAPLAIDDVAFVLVAVIIPTERVDDAIALIEGSGGTIVAEVPEGEPPGGIAQPSPQGGSDGAAEGRG